MKVSGQLGVGLLLGSVVGIVASVLAVPLSDPAPEVRVLKPPTKVITKKVVEEKVVTKQLPSSCTQLVEALETVATDLNNYYNRSRQIYLRLEDVDARMLEDQTANNDLVIEIHDYLGLAQGDLSSVLNTQHSLTLRLETCKEDTRE